MVGGASVGGTEVGSAVTGGTVRLQRTNKTAARETSTTFMEDLIRMPAFPPKPDRLSILILGETKP